MPVVTAARRVPRRCRRNLGAPQFPIQQDKAGSTPGAFTTTSTVLNGQHPAPGDVPRRRVVHRWGPLLGNKQQADGQWSGVLVGVADTSFSLLFLGVRWEEGGAPRPHSQRWAAIPDRQPGALTSDKAGAQLAGGNAIDSD